MQVQLQCFRLVVLGQTFRQWTRVCHVCQLHRAVEQAEKSSDYQNNLLSEMQELVEKAEADVEGALFREDQSLQ